MSRPIAVYLETGATRTFAGAVDWPGWCRSGRAEAEALEALVAYGERYGSVLGSSDPPFRPPRDASAFEVVERLAGGGGTDFGVPGASPSADERPLDAKELARFHRLLDRCWSAFDAAAAAASDRELRKGPRGGGRDLEKIVGHVREADEAYLAQLGSRVPGQTGSDRAREVERLRTTIHDALTARAAGRSPDDPNRVKRLWSPRYFVRRCAWHVLDHAWEIEDRVQE
jgi:DinB family protein